MSLNARRQEGAPTRSQWRLRASSRRPWVSMTDRSCSPANVDNVFILYSVTLLAARTTGKKGQRSATACPLFRSRPTFESSPDDRIPQLSQPAPHNLQPLSLPTLRPPPPAHPDHQTAPRKLPHVAQRQPLPPQHPLPIPPPFPLGRHARTPRGELLEEALGPGQEGFVVRARADEVDEGGGLAVKGRLPWLSFSSRIRD